MRPRKDIVLTGQYDECTKCDKEMDVAYLVKSKRGTRGYNKICLECNRKRQASYVNSEHSNKRKRQIIQEAKNVPCVDCKVKYPYYVMDLDHLPQHEKKFGLSNYPRYTIAQIAEEIAKCEAVCSNCHRIRTYERGAFGISMVK
jgi:hypothetical protein